MKNSSTKRSGEKGSTGRKPIFIIILFVFLLYGNSIKNDFALDDDFVTSTYDHPNKRVEKGIKGIPQLFVTRYVETEQQSFSYRPIVLVTFAIEYQFFGINPHISHFFNILIYAFLCVLLYKILRKFLIEYDPYFSLMIVLLFAAHPLHAEVVNSLKNRDELLSFLFGLLSIHYAVMAIDLNKILYLMLSIFTFCLAAITKETSLLLLPLIVGSVFIFRSPNKNRIIASGIALLVVLVFFFMRKSLIPEESLGREFVFTENPMFYDHDMLSRIPAALYILLYYLKLMLIPFPLSSYYGYSTILIAGWSEPLIWISLFIHLIMAYYAIRYFKKNKVLAFGFIFYLIAIVPYSNFFRPGVGIIAERFALPATLGFCIVISCLIIYFPAIKKIKTETKLKFSMPSMLGILAVLIVFSFRTVSRNQDWKNFETLIKRDLKYFDNSYNLNYILANSLSKEILRDPRHPKRKEMIAEAVFYYRKTADIVESGLEQAPSDHISRNNLGTLYVNYLNEPIKAVPLFKESIKLQPSYVEAYYNLGYCYEKLKMNDSAIRYYEMTLRMNDHHKEAYKRLDVIYQDNHFYTEAISAAERSIRAFPENAEFYINLGNAQLSSKDTLNGIRNFENAIKAEPSNANLKQQIHSFFRSIGYDPGSNKWAGKSF